jgi:hypothetical protein
MDTTAERFAARSGVTTLEQEGRSRCGCTATATLSPDPADDAGAPVPTGALLVLVDAVARTAACAALRAPCTLQAAGAGVRYDAPAAGRLTATATVPSDGELGDRADAAGTVRFSVAVEITDAGGQRVATGTVQWVAHLD